MDAFLQKLKRLDAYPKVNEDFYKRTLSGGVVTLVAAVVMLLLFISETSKCPFRGRRCSDLPSFFINWFRGFMARHAGCGIGVASIFFLKKLNSEACFV
jgi:hypothetical protein